MVPDVVPQAVVARFRRYLVEHILGGAVDVGQDVFGFVELAVREQPVDVRVDLRRTVGRSSERCDREQARTTNEPRLEPLKVPSRLITRAG